MLKPIFRYGSKIAIFLVILSTASYLFAESPQKMPNHGYISQNASVAEKKKGTVILREGSLSDIIADKKKEEDLSDLQKQARFYRGQGLEAQNIGNLETALSFYQKALLLDPAYAIVYNDLGVIYETNEMPERAEECYLRAIQVDPDYLSAYTNLALLYESQRKLKEAASYWDKRAQLGASGDSWTEKARDRLKDISLVLSDNPAAKNTDTEVIGLLNDVAAKKSLLHKDDKELARFYLEKAGRLSQQGDDVNAIKAAVDAQQLDPHNADIEGFIDKVKLRLLSR